MALPAWFAWMAQTPTEIRVTVDPETVQTAVDWEMKLTDRPELAVALKLTVPVPNALGKSGAKVMA